MTRENRDVAILVNLITGFRAPLLGECLLPPMRSDFSLGQRLPSVLANSRQRHRDNHTDRLPPSGLIPQRPKLAVVSTMVMFI